MVFLFLGGKRVGLQEHDGQSYYFYSFEQSGKDWTWKNQGMVIDENEEWEHLRALADFIGEC